jgi:hypothetical protein
VKRIASFGAMLALATCVGDCVLDPRFMLAPGVTIDSPGMGSTIEFSDPNKFAVHLTVANFQLYPPLSPQCAADNNHCGHIHLVVRTSDGVDCLSPGAPYNVAGPAMDDPNDRTQTTLFADLSLCPNPLAVHGSAVHLHAEVRHSDHSTIMNAQGDDVMNVMIPRL